MTETAPTFSQVCTVALLMLLVFWIGKQRNFFTFTAKAWRVPIRLQHVVIAFLIYFGVSSFLTPIIGHALHSLFFQPPTSTSFLRYAGWINAINSTLIFLILSGFFLSLPQLLRKLIWLRPDLDHVDYGAAFRAALWSWVLSFPAVLFVNQLLDWIIFLIFQNIQAPDQLAVYFLKMTFGSPLYFVLAALTIVVFAPIIEELLFRGFLQSWIRQHLGGKQAILISSVLFAFFHYSPEQGISNITIIGSLFVLSLFIGFVYEKQGSLVSSMMLHALFNLLNVCNLYFFGGIFDRGLQIHL